MLRKAKQFPGSFFHAIFLLFLFSSLFASVLLTNARDVPQNSSSAPSSTARNSKQTANDSNPERGTRFNVDVDLVMMYTSAFDSAGRFVAGLKPERFKVYEDGVEQKISSFAQEDVPVTMGILLDLSGSMRSTMDQVNKAALAFIRVGNPEDQVFLVGFNDEAELLQDFTSDIDEIQDSLDNAVVSGGTVLYDAIYLGVEKAHSGNKAKKAIVAITDGEDRDSSYSLDELVTKVQESDVQVFCVGFLKDQAKKRGSTSKKAYDALTRISEETGGKAFFPKQIDEIHNIVAEIAGELRSQYSIGYFSSNLARDGSFRRVKISLSENKAQDINLRYRRGYFASKAEVSPSPASGAPNLKK
jgi:Ca-activated chloride channel homolog